MGQEGCYGSVTLPEMFENGIRIEGVGPVGSRYKLWMVQWSACGAVVGTMEFVSVGSMVAT